MNLCVAATRAGSRQGLNAVRGTAADYSTLLTAAQQVATDGGQARRLIVERLQIRGFLKGDRKRVRGNPRAVQHYRLALQRKRRMKNASVLRFASVASCSW